MATKGYTVNVRVGATITDFDKKMQKVTKSIKQVGTKMQKTGEALTKGISLPILAAATALGGVVVSSAKTADELIRLADVTGMTTTEIQQMQYAAQQLGTDFDTIEGAQTKLTRSIADAASGNKDAIKSFESIGVAIYDTNGKLKDAPTLFNETLDALGKISDPVLRDAAAMDLMGKSARDLNPLIKAGSSEIERLKKEALATGAVMGEKTVYQLGSLNDTLDSLKMQLQAAGGELAVKLAPAFQSLAKFIEEKVIPSIQFLVDKFVSLNAPVQIIIGVLAALLLILPPLIMFLGAMALSLTAISWPVVGVVAGIAALIAVIMLLWTNWDKVQKFFLWTWDLIKKAFSFAFDNIPILKLFKLIYDNWDSISKFILSVWDKIKEGFSAAINFIIDLFEGYINTWIKGLNLIISTINLIPGVNIKQISQVDFNGNNLNSAVGNSTKSAQPINVYVGGQKLNNIVDYNLGTKAFSGG